MKFCQLREYNMKNIFLEKPYTKYDGETIPRPFYWKAKIEHISGSTVWTFIQFVLLHFQVDGYHNVLKLSCCPLAFTSCTFYIFIYFYN